MERVFLRAKSKKHTFVKPVGDSYSSHLVIRLHESGSLKKSIKRFLRERTIQGEKSVHWKAGNYETSKGSVEYCQGGDFEPLQNTQLYIDSNSMRHFSLCIFSTPNHRNTVSVYHNFLKSAFHNIKIPVYDKCTENQEAELVGEPVCMMAYTGNDPSCGHYLCLIKEENEWVIIEDSAPLAATKNPAEALNRKQMMPYVVHYRAVELRTKEQDE